MNNTSGSSLKRGSSQLLDYRITALGLLVPLLSIPLLFLWHWNRPVGAFELSIFFTLYIASNFGITVGYHRLFTHKSFDTYPIIKVLFGALGSMSWQGPLLYWIAIHRAHHAMSDTEEDPHSPNKPRGGWLGFWKGHIGWTLDSATMESLRYGRWGRQVRDLLRDDLAWFLQRTYFLWAALGILIPSCIGGFLAGWDGAISGFLWGGLFRIAASQHTTFLVNSVCHMFGKKHFKTTDESRNNVVVGILALGEGWHNNHHAFPSSARHGLLWWQLDFSWRSIRCMERIGLAHNVKVPSAEALSRRRLYSQSSSPSLQEESHEPN